MATDLKRLKQHFKAYEPTLKELERKYQVGKPTVEGHVYSIVNGSWGGVPIQRVHTARTAREPPFRNHRLSCLACPKVNRAAGVSSDALFLYGYFAELVLP